jgi:hypothetical protein
VEQGTKNQHKKRIKLYFMNNEILFTESQRFKQWWLWLILLGINGFFIYGLYEQVVAGQQFGNKPMSDTELFITCGLFFLFTILFFNFRLDTEIRSNGIYVRFFPIHFTYKYYPWSKISKLYIRQYSPIIEFGGWGIRLELFGKGKAYNISGDRGLQLIFTDNKKLLIGTNKPDELAQTLDKLGQHKK